MKEYPDQIRGLISFPRGFNHAGLKIGSSNRNAVCHACSQIIVAGTERVEFLVNGLYEFRNGGLTTQRKWCVHKECVRSLIDGENEELFNRQFVYDVLFKEICWNCRERLDEFDLDAGSRLFLPPPFSLGWLCVKCSYDPAYKICSDCKLFHQKRSCSPVLSSGHVLCFRCEEWTSNPNRQTERALRRVRNRIRKEQEAEQKVLDEYEALVVAAEAGELFSG